MKKWLLALVLLGLPGCVKVRGQRVQVSIWVLYTSRGVAISVLPGSQVPNPQAPAKIKEVQP